ncbi:hypothetical protein LTR78_010957 [Recurvomyces mirabilis]|uniref:Uncharacterized protein n=1 Tax=Recurvomyces mirabilis TaxID=574656 RepID=A0AAE0TLK0_9PEZI|nr:hypothetical protein LTR78_010957 [Recurvomyces mirabilis]
MDVDSFPTIEKMTPPASTWMSRTPRIPECARAGLEVTIVTHTAQDSSQTCSENGHGVAGLSVGPDSYFENPQIANVGERRRSTSPEVPDSASTCDLPSCATQKIVADNSANELCRDNQDNLVTLGADASPPPTSSQRLTDATVLASTAGSYDDEQVPRSLPKARDETTIETSVAAAANELPEAVSSKSHDTAPFVPDIALEGSLEDVSGEATSNVSSEAGAITETLGEAILTGEPVGAREWDPDALTNPTTPLQPHAEPAQTASVISPASLAETPGAKRIPDESAHSPTPPSYSQDVLSTPDLLARAQDEVDTEVSTELSEPDRNAMPLVEGLDAPLPSASAIAQRKISPNVPASRDTDMAEKPSPLDLPDAMSPISSLADRSETPRPKMLHSGDPDQTGVPVAPSPSPLQDVTLLQMPESLTSDLSQIEVALGKGLELSLTDATDEVPAADRVSTPNAAPQAASSMAEDSDPISDDELSSPLMRKNAHRERGDRKRTPASGFHGPRRARPRENTLVERPSRRALQGQNPDRNIPYATFGLDSSQLIITYESHPVHPLALYMGSTARNQAELTQARIKKLDSTRSELLDYPPMAGNSEADHKDANLIRRLCLSPLRDEDTPRLVDAVKALRRRSEVAEDEVNLFRCLESLMVMVTQQYNEEEVGVTAEVRLSYVFMGVSG